MSVNAENTYDDLSNASFQHDAEPSVALGDNIAVPVTATGSGDWLEFGLKPSGYFQVNAVVTEADAADTDETYQLALEVADDVSGTNAVEIARWTLTAGYTGSYELPVHGPTFDRAIAGEGKAIRITHVLGGTSPSLGYAAQVGPVVGNAL